MIKGKKLVLRALEPADVDLLYKWENNIDHWHVSNTLEPFSRFLLEQYVMNSNHDLYTDKQLRLMIHTQDDNRPVGNIDLFDFSPTHRRAGIAILILSDEREKGFAAEALSLLIEYAFYTLNMHQLYCNIGADNAGSIRLFEQAGFQRIGTKKDWQLRSGVWMDELFYQLINPRETTT